MKTLVVDEQELFCPSLDEWEDLKSDLMINGIRIPLIDFITKRVTNNLRYTELKSVLGQYKGKIYFYELLKIENELVRVHTESVICENCGKRPTISATPSVVDIYVGVEDKDKAKKRGFKFPNLRCRYCNSLYERRYTIWQDYD